MPNAWFPLFETALKVAEVSKTTDRRHFMIVDAAVALLLDSETLTSDQIRSLAKLHYVEALLTSIVHFSN